MEQRLSTNRDKIDAIQKNTNRVCQKCSRGGKTIFFFKFIFIGASATKVGKSKEFLSMNFMREREKLMGESEETEKEIYS